MQRLRRGAAFAAAIAVLSIGVVACGSDSGDDSADAGDAAGATEEVQLVLPFNEGIAFIGLLVAKDRYYAEEGVEVETLVTEGSNFVSQQLISGQEKFGIIAAPDLVVARAKGRDLVSLATVSYDAFSFAVPEGSDVESVADLEGKSLGVTRIGGGESALVEAALEEEGLTAGEDVEIVPVGDGGPTSYQALKSGRVAAFAGAYNDMAALETEGLTFTTFLPETFADLPSDIFVTTDEVLQDEADRETAIKLVRGWLKGTVFARENPEAALEIACEQVPQECRDKEGAMNFLNRTLETIEPRGKLGSQNVEAFQVVADSLVTDLSKEVDVTDAVVTDYQDQLVDFDEAAVKEEAAGEGGGQ